MMTKYPLLLGSLLRIRRHAQMPKTDANTYKEYGRPSLEYLSAAEPRATGSEHEITDIIVPNLSFMMLCRSMTAKIENSVLVARKEKGERVNTWSTTHKARKYRYGIALTPLVSEDSISPRLF